MLLTSSFSKTLFVMGLLAFLFDVPAAWPADQASLVKDLNTAKGLDYLTFASTGNFVYFQNYDPSHGVELWKSDGTLENSGVVKDIRPGSGSSFPDNLTAAGSLLYFTAEDGVHGRELWRTDGTETGTFLVRDITPGDKGTPFGGFMAAGSLLYFLAPDNTSIRQLWETDGTSSGTLPLKDIVSGSWNVNSLSLLAAVGSTLFFSAYDSTHRYALWKTDGAATGTAMVKSDLHAGSEGAAVVGARLFFWAGAELWSSDGTTTGTSMITDFPSGWGWSFPASAVAAGPLYFFSLSDPAHGCELWRSDGTTSGTVLVKDIRPGPDSGLNYWEPQKVPWKSKLWFAADDGTHGRQLWVSDGTATGTLMVTSKSGGAELRRLTPTDSVLCFLDFEVNSGFELWKSDGTAGGTRRVKDIWPGDRSSCWDWTPRMPTLGSDVLFRASDDVHGGALWKSDGTTAGTVMVGDFLSGSHSPLVFFSFGVVGSKVVFQAAFSEIEMSGVGYFATDGTATGTVHQYELLPGVNVYGDTSILGCMGSTYFFRAVSREQGEGIWKSDGTVSGTQLVKSNLNYLVGNGPHLATALGSTLYFQAGDNNHGYELCKTDGTSAGTVLVKDILPGIASSYPRNMISAGSNLFFLANDGVNGQKLWSTDGTETGTVLLDINPNAASISFSEFTVAGSNLFFLANDGENGQTIWKSDGTKEGTEPIKVFPNGFHYSGNFQVLGSNLFFNAEAALWRTDGTKKGTSVIKDFPGSDSMSESVVAGTNLFFLVGRGTYELWKSDGTSEGTVPVKALSGDVLGVESGTPLMPLGSCVYFAMESSDQGRGLWVSDGTAAGTRKVKEVELRPMTSFYEKWWATVNNVLYFIASDSLRGTELWRTDGTEAGTYLVEDIYVGSRSSNPENLIVCGSTLLFTADDGIWGRELWKVTGPGKKPTRVGKGWPLYK